LRYEIRRYLGAFCQVRTDVVQLELGDPAVLSLAISGRRLRKSGTVTALQLAGTSQSH
jgi:hypothetical protein